ncbi:Outer membrane lipoprotein-sorting protein [Sulfidibacter corallicola]|uniref:Outer membrane lipoprotein-sorting protein n=1 Tax=Sulfidibacter corallicola TaxID=2818388 RepID=A0A8A4TKH0_SULCO|nr:outer membrane lipoprotein-sorting protein [Sulfidibacter corallicola]QTD50509.1 outer membrane lipoprotein-sorting protein [Sulfidibacter corallicola]
MITYSIFLVSFLALFPSPTEPSLDHYGQVLDNLYRGKSTQGTLVMTIVTPHYERTLQMDMWTLGLDHTLVRLRSPRKERGNGSLKRGNEMWNYLRKIDKLVRIPPSMMMSSWMGGDFTNDDIVRDSSWSEDFDARLGQAEPGRVTVIYRPKENVAVTWSRIEVVFDETNGLPTTQSYFDEKEEKVRVLTYSDVKEVDGRLIPTTLTMDPIKKDGQSTRLEYRELKFDVDLKETFFTTGKLRKGI